MTFHMTYLSFCTNLQYNLFSIGTLLYLTTAPSYFPSARSTHKFDEQRTFLLDVTHIYEPKEIIFSTFFKYGL
jgi:hypothetical protein